MTLSEIMTKLDSLRAEVALNRTSSTFQKDKSWFCRLTLSMDGTELVTTKWGASAGEATEAAWLAVAYVASKGMDLKALAAPTLDPFEPSLKDELPF